MTRKLIIDGNAVYEIDENCMLKNRVEDDDDGKEKKKRNAGREYGQKSGQEDTVRHSRLR